MDIENDYAHIRDAAKNNWRRYETDGSTKRTYVKRRPITFFGHSKTNNCVQKSMLEGKPLRNK